MKTFSKSNIAQRDTKSRKALTPIDTTLPDSLNPYFLFALKHEVLYSPIRYLLFVSALILSLIYSLFNGHWHTFIGLSIAFVIKTGKLYTDLRELYKTLSKSVYYRLDASGVSLMTPNNTPYLTEKWELVKKVYAHSNGIAIEMEKDSEIAMINIIDDNVDENLENILGFWKASMYPEQIQLDSDEEKVINILKKVGCEVTILGSHISEEELTRTYLKNAKIQERRGYTNIIIELDDIFKTNVLEEFEVDYKKDFSTYAQEKLSTPYLDAEKIFAEKIKEIEADYKDVSDIDWEKEIVGERADEEECDKINSILLSTSDNLFLSVNIPVASAHDLFCYIPTSTIEGPSQMEHRSIAKYWFERHGAVPCFMSGDVVQYHVEHPVSKNDSSKLAWEQFGQCVDIILQNNITVKELEQTLENSTFWFFWWD